MPGRCSTVGSMPRAAPRRGAGRSCCRRSAAAPRRAASTEPHWSPARRAPGAMVKAGAARCAASSCVISAGRDAGMSPGSVRMPVCALGRQQARRGHHGAGMAVASRLRSARARRSRPRQRRRLRIDRDDETAGKPGRRGDRVQHVLQHDERQCLALLRRSGMRRAAAWSPAYPSPARRSTEPS